MYGLALAVGFIGGPVNPMLVNVRMERIPEALRGRVFATFSGLAGAAIPLGMVSAGWLLEATGDRTGLLAIAVIATVFLIGLWLAKPLLEMNDESIEIVDFSPYREPLAHRSRQTGSESN
jgi:MFS family permease